MALFRDSKVEKVGMLPGSAVGIIHGVSVPNLYFSNFLQFMLF